MTVTVKNKSALTVPTEVQRRAGTKPGDQLEFKVSGGVITIVPKLLHIVRITAETEIPPAGVAGVLARMTQTAEAGKMDIPDASRPERRRRQRFRVELRVVA